MAQADEPAANREPSRPALPNRSLPPPSRTPPASSDSKPDRAVLAIANAIDTLTSPQTGFGERKALWDALRQAGELDDVIVGLKELAADNPDDATLSLALGEAELAKIKSLRETGENETEVDILALQADQNFGQALKIDPTNWEAQFEKAASLSHWPPALNKGPEVIQMLSSLVTQQETMPLQPEFAQTYVILGKQYQAAGQNDKAIQTWQLGAAKFPLNTTLQKNLAQANNQP
jgi:tetratricopeptide (TPR) repeat protein